MAGVACMIGVTSVVRVTCVARVTSRATVASACLTRYSVLRMSRVSTMLRVPVFMRVMHAVRGSLALVWRRGMAVMMRVRVAHVIVAMGMVRAETLTARADRR